MNERINGGYGFGERNEAGEKVLGFASSYELAMVDIYFRKSEMHYITYKRGINRLQNDYFL